MRKNVVFPVYLIMMPVVRSMYEMPRGVKKKRRIANCSNANPLKSSLLGQTTYQSTVTRVESRKTARIATNITDLFIFHF